MPKLSEAELSDARQQLPGWSVLDDELHRKFYFSTFADGIAFVNRVADVAEEREHHPDITINYSTVALALSTHSEGGITERDIDLARRIDSLVAR